jgi:hypothetical protein
MPDVTKTSGRSKHTTRTTTDRKMRRMGTMGTWRNRELGMASTNDSRHRRSPPQVQSHNVQVRWRPSPLPCPCTPLCFLKAVETVRQRRANETARRHRE